MKYIILSYASQQHYDAMSGNSAELGLKPDDFAAMYAWMADFNQSLADSGELVETRALAAPVHTRRVGGRDGVPYVTDGPYAETQEVLAGYWVVECASFDRATEIAARLGECPAPPGLAANAYADVRPLVETPHDLEG
ncbi:YciI family protein [Nonomuraea sp. NPDC047529]|uniref:YciI family protein n=1 Tax=Nonomuraea sp. NPDC047529 TaxID=3155623 RepID=UPI0033C8E452